MLPCISFLLLSLIVFYICYGYYPEYVVSFFKIFIRVTHKCISLMDLPHLPVARRYLIQRFVNTPYLWFLFLSKQILWKYEHFFYVNFVTTYQIFTFWIQRNTSLLTILIYICVYYVYIIWMYYVKDNIYKTHICACHCCGWL